VDRAVTERSRERVVHAPVLLEKGETIECGGRENDLEVVAGSRAIFHRQLDRIGESAFQNGADRFGFHPAMLPPASLGAVRPLRTLGLLTLGALAGFAGAAALVKRSMPSRGGEESDEVQLVAIFDGVELKSRATAFRGGSMLAWFGGVAVDLREAQLAPEAHISAHSLFGGIAVRIPPGWRVESTATALSGGVAISAPDPDNPAAPTLTLDGFALFGGIAVGSRVADAAFDH
jgi:hypothetical protein